MGIARKADDQLGRASCLEQSRKETTGHCQLLERGGDCRFDRRILFQLKPMAPPRVAPDPFKSCTLWREARLAAPPRTKRQKAELSGDVGRIRGWMNHKEAHLEWCGSADAFRPTPCAACSDGPCPVCPWLSPTPCSLSPRRGLSMCHHPFTLPVKPAT
jgi:hypothetical protein